MCIRDSNQIHLFLLADAFDPEHRTDVDDPNAAHFHVVSSHFGAGTHHFPPIHQRHLGDIVSYQAVAALDQRQDALALADAALTADDHADPEDIHHAPHLG